MSRSRLQAIFDDFPEMEQRLLSLAIIDLVHAQDQLLLLGRKTATERLASFLLLQTTCPQPRSVLWPRVYLPMSRNDVGDYLGMTNETVTRSIAKLKKLGAIAIPNVHEIVILDLAQLGRLAHGL